LKKACCAWCVTATPICWKTSAPRRNSTDEISDKLKSVVDGYAKSFA
jgi:hypothetical protein